MGSQACPPWEKGERPSLGKLGWWMRESRAAISYLRSPVFTTNVGDTVSRFKGKKKLCHMAKQVLMHAKEKFTIRNGNTLQLAAKQLKRMTLEMINSTRPKSERNLQFARCSMMAIWRHMKTKTNGHYRLHSTVIKVVELSYFVKLCNAHSFTSFFFCAHLHAFNSENSVDNRDASLVVLHWILIWWNRQRQHNPQPALSKSQEILLWTPRWQSSHTANQCKVSTVLHLAVSA